MPRRPGEGQPADARPWPDARLPRPRGLGGAARGSTARDRRCRQRLWRPTAQDCVLGPPARRGRIAHRRGPQPLVGARRGRADAALPAHRLGHRRRVRLRAPGQHRRRRQLPLHAPPVRSASREIPRLDDGSARIGWFVNDLHPHALPYHFFRHWSGLARWHRFVQHDGPVSIARASGWRTPPESCLAIAASTTSTWPPPEPTRDIVVRPFEGPELRDMRSAPPRRGGRILARQRRGGLARARRGGLAQATGPDSMSSCTLRMRASGVKGFSRNAALAGSPRRARASPA